MTGEPHRAIRAGLLERSGTVWRAVLLGAFILVPVELGLIWVELRGIRQEQVKSALATYEPPPITDKVPYHLRENWGKLSPQRANRLAGTARVELVGSPEVHVEGTVEVGGQPIEVRPVQ